MKKIGLVGGVGPASTIDYYNGLIKLYHERIDADGYPQIVIDSINMTEMISAFTDKRYDDVCKLLSGSVHNLKAAGAEIAAICSNTPHIVWDEMVSSFEIPVISIVDAAVNEMLQKNYRKVLIFGTIFTMSSGLYDKKLLDQGITPVIPTDEDKKIIGSLIFPNLENGIIIPEDKKKMIALAEKYISSEKADAMLLGCTEIPLMIKEGDVSVPVIDTTQIHIETIFQNIQ